MKKVPSQFILLNQNIPKILSIFKLILHNTDNLQEKKIRWLREVVSERLEYYLGLWKENFCNFLILNNLSPTVQLICKNGIRQKRGIIPQEWDTEGRKEKLHSIVSVWFACLPNNYWTLSQNTRRISGSRIIWKYLVMHIIERSLFHFLSQI